jgi:Tfp pilus assembly protein PilN
MKAVNLIPAEERRGVGSAGSGLAAYIVLAALALAVVVGAAYTLTNRSVSDRRQELAEVQARAKASADQARALQAYTSFTALRQKRSETVRSLAASRFDWSHALHEVARTIPSNAWLTGLRATVTPNASVDSGVTDPLRASVPAPAIEIVGCTTSQKNVAGVIASLRRVDGVDRVSLSSSEKLDVSAGTGAKSDGSTGGSEDCRNGNARFPRFSMTLFFTAPTQTTTQGTTP